MKEGRIYVVLENAHLEIAKNSKSKTQPYQLLSSDSPPSLLKKFQKNPSELRPDILHSCLLTLLDSPLNKSNKLTVFIRAKTSDNSSVLIQVNPKTRIPRTFARFSGLMVQLLHKLAIKSVDNEILMKVIKNDIENALPVGCKRIAMSGDGPCVRLREYVSQFNESDNICIAIGAFAAGKDDFADDYIKEKIAVSKFPLSAAVVCGKLCNAFEELLNIT